MKKTAEITELLKSHWGLSTDVELAEQLGVDRQSIQRYKNRSTADLQTRAIELLLEELAKNPGD